jgi:hypothetical protein
MRTDRVLSELEDEKRDCFSEARGEKMKKLIL